MSPIISLFTLVQGINSIVAVGVIDLPEFWEGLFTAIVGVLFWIIGLAILYVIYERYLKDKDQPDNPDGGE